MLHVKFILQHHYWHALLAHKYDYFTRGWGEELVYWGWGYNRLVLQEVQVMVNGERKKEIRNASLVCGV